MSIQGRHCVVGCGVAIVVGALLGFVINLPSDVTWE